MTASAIPSRSISDYQPHAMPIVIDTMQSWLNGAPVWARGDIYKLWGTDFENYRARWDRAPVATSAFDRTRTIYDTRIAYIEAFGFAIPCSELLDCLAAERRIVEVGAGSGFMTRLMRLRGIDVVGTDHAARGYSGYGFDVGRFDERQINGVAGKTAARRYRDATIFCSWPSLDETWFRQMLKAMQIGQRLIVIQESCCAEATAWSYLDEHFHQEASIDLPNFEFINDYATVHVKKRQRPFRDHQN